MCFRTSPDTRPIHLLANLRLGYHAGRPPTMGKVQAATASKASEVLLQRHKLTLRAKIQSRHRRFSASKKSGYMFFSEFQFCANVHHLIVLQQTSNFKKKTPQLPSDSSAHRSDTSWAPGRQLQLRPLSVPPAPFVPRLEGGTLHGCGACFQVQTVHWHHLGPDPETCW